MSHASCSKCNITLTQKFGKEKLLILKTKRTTAFTEEIFLIDTSLIETSPNFLSLGKQESYVNKQKSTYFCVFKPSFVVNSLIVKPERVAQ